MIAEHEAAFTLDREAVEAICRAVTLPDAPRPRHRRPLPADRAGASARRAHRRAAGDRRRRRPHDPGPPPGPRQPADPRLRPVAARGSLDDRHHRRPRRPGPARCRAPRRALYISSPIGLGHAQRDVAIAAELRKLHPDLEIDWLAQHPVTAVLEAHGERIHPAERLSSRASRRTSPPSRPSHDLNAFQAIRRMDEILVANFMVFHDAVEQGEYDLVIGDEAWDVDYYLHENPELKRTAFAWMTDFVGWLPMPDGGEREAFLTADYNAEMIEHVARFPRIRDRAIFVGDPDDIVPDDFGPGLPRHPRLDRAALRVRGVRDRVRPDGAGRGARGAPPGARLPRRRARGHRHGRRVRRRRGAPPTGHRELSRGRPTRPGPADDRGRRAADRPGGARRAGGRRGPRLRAGPLPAPRRRGPRGRPGRPDDDDGARRRRGGRSCTSRCANHFEQNRHVAPPARPLRRRPADGLRDLGLRRRSRRPSPLEIDRPIDYRPVASDGAARAAALIAELV